MTLSKDASSAILKGLPKTGSKIVNTSQCGQSHYGRTLRLTVQLPLGSLVNYFLKIMEGELGLATCRGEHESLKAIYSVCHHTPEPYTWGVYTEYGKVYAFLLTEFLTILKQPADPEPLAMALTEIHMKSQSPTGKFGFQLATCHTRNLQAVDFWTDSWCELFSNHLSRILSHARKQFSWATFDQLGEIILSRVVPALLFPLQMDGRSIKPCLVHGDCWDGNTAMTDEGRAVLFDATSFYAHNEYELGNWRAPRHALSHPRYTSAYKALIPISEPAKDWDSRNLLYSLPWNICNALFVPNSTQKPVVFQDMISLCQRICPQDLNSMLSNHDISQNISRGSSDLVQSRV